MKGNISLKDFIKEVKEDLRSAVDEDDPFFIMNDVELEVSFGLNVEAGAGAKLVVFDLSSKAKAEQTHKVKISLTPFVDSNKDPSKKPVNSKSEVKVTKSPEAMGVAVKVKARPTASAGKRVRPTASAGKTEAPKKPTAKKKSAK